MIDLSLPAPKPLAELEDQLQALFDTYEGATDPEIRKELEEQINAALEAEVRKVDRVSFYLKRCENDMAFCRNEIEGLRAHISLLENRRQRVRDYVQRVMEANSLQRLDGSAATFSIRAGTPSVVVNDELAVPDEFKTVTMVVSIDRRAIKAAIEAGRMVPGADLQFGMPTLAVRR